MKRAYCTTISNKKYLMGALGLYYSLQKVGVKYPFILLMAERVKEEDENVETIFEGLENFEYRYFKNFDDLGKTINGKKEYNIIKKMILDDSRFISEFDMFTYEKFAIYSIDDYDEVIFFDADIVVTKNADELFDKYPAPTFMVMGNKEDYKKKEIPIKEMDYSTFFGIHDPKLLTYENAFDAFRRRSVVDKYIVSGKKGEVEVKDDYGRYMVNMNDEGLAGYVYESIYDKITSIPQAEVISYLYHFITVGLDENYEDGKFAKYWLKYNLDNFEKLSTFLDNNAFKTGMELFNGDHEFVNEDGSRDVVLNGIKIE